MLPWEEKMKLKALISESVRGMCKDGLMPQLNGDFFVEGLIGVTVGKDELLMVSIHEKLCGEVTRSTSISSPPSGHSTKRKITHAPDWSEEAQTATEDANNTKKARYSDSFSESVTSEPTQDRDNSEKIQVSMEDNTVRVNKAGYLESCDARGELIPDKPIPGDPTGSLLMSAEECETDFLFSTETRSSSVTNSSTNVKTLPHTSAVYSNSGKDMNNVKTPPPTERSEDIDNVKTPPPTERSKDIDNVKTPPPTERRMSRRSSARNSTACGANFEVANTDKDINLDAQKKTCIFQTKFDDNTRMAKFPNNCKKTKGSKRTVTNNATDCQKPDENARIKDVRVELQDIVGISSMSPQKHLVNDKNISSDDDDTDDAFDDVDDELSSDTHEIVAPVGTDSLADRSNSLTSVKQGQSSASPERNQSSYSSGDQIVLDGMVVYKVTENPTSVTPGESVEIDTSSASPDRNQSSYSSECGDEAVEDSVSRNQPHATDSTLQFNIKSELLDKAEGSANHLQITDVRQVALVIVKPEPQEPFDYKDLNLLDDYLETDPQDENVEPEPVDGNMEPEPQMETDQLFISGTVHQFGLVTNSFKHEDTITKPARQMDEDSDQIPPMNVDTKAVHQIEIAENSLHPKGETTSSNHCTKYLCKECGANLKNKYFYHKHMKNHATASVCNRCNQPYTVGKYHCCEVTIDGKEAFRCNVCEITYKAAITLENHYKNVHLGIHHKCPHCKKEFGEKNQVRLHIHAVHKKEPLSCYHCGKYYPTRDSLIAHRIIHLSEGHQCPQCNSKFRDRNTLRRHIRTLHKKFMPYSCEYCGKCFPIKQDLKGHQWMHTREKKYKCRVCHMTFPQVAPFLKHMKLHDGIEAYPCPHCSVVSAHENTLKRHVLKNHSEVTSGTAK